MNKKDYARFKDIHKYNNNAYNVNESIVRYDFIDSLEDDIYYDDLKYNYDDYNNEFIDTYYEKDYMIDYIRNLIFERTDLYLECIKYINIYDDLELKEIYNSGILNEIFKDLNYGELEYLTNSNDYETRDYDNGNFLMHNEWNKMWICDKCTTVNYTSGKNCICKKCKHPLYTRKPARNSKGEELIRRLLNDNNLRYSEQYPLQISKTSTLRYDFLVGHKGVDYFIEVNGGQHYKPIEYFGGIESFEKSNERYEIKKNYALENGVFIELDYRESNLDLLEQRFYNEFYNKYIRGIE